MGMYTFSNEEKMHYNYVSLLAMAHGNLYIEQQVVRALAEGVLSLPYHYFFFVCTSCVNIQ